MTNNLTVTYGDTSLEVAAGTSLNDVKASMSRIFPELKNSEAVLEGNQITFRVKAGTKGAENMTNSLTVSYGDTSLTVPAGTSLASVKESMSRIFPELKNAEAILEGESITFKVKAGTKGSDSLTVSYGDTSLTVPAGTSLASVKESMSRIFPELKNSEAVLEGNSITFKVKAGTKGSDNLTVTYGDTSLEVAAGTSLADVKASMSRIFPELKNAEAILDGSSITFRVKAGTKGADALTVSYGDTSLTVPAGTSLASVKESMSRIFPELKNAEAVLEGNSISFKVKAGTKGADTLRVTYGDTTLEVAAGTSLNDVKASMSRIFPELKNSEAVLEGQNITFRVKAGTKGANLTVTYGDTSLEVAEGTSLNDVKASMSRIFPELKNAEAVLEGSSITFKVKAGTKGN